MCRENIGSKGILILSGPQRCLCTGQFMNLLKVMLS